MRAAFSFLASIASYLFSFLTKLSYLVPEKRTGRTLSMNSVVKIQNVQPSSFQIIVPLDSLSLSRTCMSCSGKLIEWLGFSFPWSSSSFVIFGAEDSAIGREKKHTRPELEVHVDNRNNYFRTYQLLHRYQMMFVCWSCCMLVCVFCIARSAVTVIAGAFKCWFFLWTEANLRQTRRQATLGVRLSSLTSSEQIDRRSVIKE